MSQPWGLHSSKPRRFPLDWQYGFPALRQTPEELAFSPAFLNPLPAGSDDAELVRRVALRDPDAFTLIYGRRSTLLFPSP